MVLRHATQDWWGQAKRILRTGSRMRRRAFWLSLMSAWLLFGGLYWLIQTSLGTSLTLILYPPMLWALLIISARRCHDAGWSAMRLLLLLIPVLGPLWYFLVLGLKGSEKADNRYGPYEGAPLPDYLVVA